MLSGFSRCAAAVKRVALGAVLAAAAASGAHAGVAVLADVYEPGGPPLPVDFTVPTDGSAELWTFRLETTDPLADLELDLPNQVFALYRVRSFSGLVTTIPDFSAPLDYAWEVTKGPGFASYRVQGPASFDRCDTATTAGVCAASYSVWGNGTTLKVASAAPGRLIWSVTRLDAAVPEPGTWSLLLAGFFTAGAALRRRTYAPAAS